MNITIPAQLAGYFKFEAVNVDTGERRLLSDWQPNLITNAGLDLIGSLAGGVVRRVFVGSGQTPASVTDTALVSLVATASSTTSNVSGASSSAPYYGFLRTTWRFSAGQAQGNLSEVGVGGTSGALFSRSLIKDSGGNPTTITVLSNEYLDVTYELRLYAPTTDLVGQLTLGTEVHDVTVRAANVTSTSFWYIGLGLSSASSTAPNVQTQYAYSGPIGAVTASPTGYSSAGVPSDVVYAAGSQYREVDLDWSLTSGNFGTGIRSILFCSNVGTYQAEFDPPIMKDNTKTFRATVRFAWARRP